ncbi:CidA/LrgA family protein [Anaeromyxobacter diazotrophicus]|nr:CidA/LrgA family protein [Anaeromyxobacter diazotrophicus]
MTLAPRLRPLLQIAALLPFWAAGAALAAALHLPVPGPVLGLGLLLAALQLGLVRPAWFEEGASWLIRHMLLFFVPAAVGVVAYPALLGGEGLRILAVVAVSTVAVMVATGAAAEAVARRRSARR